MDTLEKTVSVLERLIRIFRDLTKGILMLLMIMSL